MEAVIVYLSSISFFRQMSREEMEGVGSSFKLHSLGANQPLFEKGDPVESLWVVLSGRVALQPRAESMTAASPKARLSRSLPSRVSKLNRSTNRRISVLEAGFAPQSTGNKDGSIAKDGLGDAHPSGNDAAADDSSIVWYRPGDAFGDAELRAHHGAVGLYAAVEPTELLELPRASTHRHRRTHGPLPVSRSGVAPPVARRASRGKPRRPRACMPSSRAASPTRASGPACGSG